MELIFGYVEARTGLGEARFIIYLTCKSYKCNIMGECNFF